MKKLKMIAILFIGLSLLGCGEDEKACNPPLGTINAEIVEAEDLPPNTVALQGSVHTGFEGLWKIMEGEGGSFSNTNMPQTNFTGMAGETYILRWELTGCNVFNKDVSVTIGCETLQANAGADQQTTNTTIPLNGNLPVGTTGLWTIVSGNNGQLSNATLNNTNFTGVAGNTYTLRWALTNACGETSFDEVTVQITQVVNVSNRYMQTLADGQPFGIYEYNDAGQITKITNSFNGNSVVTQYEYQNGKLFKVVNTYYYYKADGSLDYSQIGLPSANNGKTFYFFENDRLIRTESKTNANNLFQKIEYEYLQDGYVQKTYVLQTPGDFSSPFVLSNQVEFGYYTETEFLNKVAPPAEHTIDRADYYLPWKFGKSYKYTNNAGVVTSNYTITHTFDVLGRIQTSTSTNNLTNTSSVTTYIY